MSQDYILLDPSQYYENNIATDITKYSRKEYNTVATQYVENTGVENTGVENTGVENTGVENTIKLADISNFYATQVSTLQSDLDNEIDFSEKLKRTIMILTTLVILILIILFIMVICLKNKAIL